jgi:hypothetical protein
MSSELITVSAKTEDLIKTYAKRYARSHILKKICTPGIFILDTEKQLLEMALSRLKENLLSCPYMIERNYFIKILTKEILINIDNYADISSKNEIIDEISAIPEEDIFPNFH